MLTCGADSFLACAYGYMSPRLPQARVEVTVGLHLAVCTDTGVPIMTVRI